MEAVAQSIPQMSSTKLKRNHENVMHLNDTLSCFRNGDASTTETRGLPFYDDPADEPMLSERAASVSGLVDLSTDRHVQFSVGQCNRLDLSPRLFHSQTTYARFSRSQELPVAPYKMKVPRTMPTKRTSSSRIKTRRITRRKESTGNGWKIRFCVHPPLCLSVVGAVTP